MAMRCFAKAWNRHLQIAKATPQGNIDLRLMHMPLANSSLAFTVRSLAGHGACFFRPQRFLSASNKPMPYAGNDKRHDSERQPILWEDALREMPTIPVSVASTTFESYGRFDNGQH